MRDFIVVLVTVIFHQDTLCSPAYEYNSFKTDSQKVPTVEGSSIVFKTSPAVTNS